MLFRIQRWSTFSTMMLVALAAIVMALGMGARVAFTHQDPGEPGELGPCNASGVGLTIVPLNESGAIISGSVRHGEVVAFRVVMSIPSLGETSSGQPTVGCNFTGGELSITLPNGMSKTYPGPADELSEKDSNGQTLSIRKSDPYRVDQADANQRGEVIATAVYVGGTYHDSKTHDASSGDANSTTSRPLQLQAPGIQIQKTADPTQILTGQNAIFSITVENTGGWELTNVVVTDAAAPNCSNSWLTLSPGKAQTINNCSVQVNEKGDGTFENSASVTAQAVGDSNRDGIPESEEVRDSDSATVEVVELSVKIDLEPEQQEVAVGRNANFRITITNDGDVPLERLEVSDDELSSSSNCARTGDPSFILPLLPHASTSGYLCSVTMPQAGTFLYTATVIGRALGEPTSHSASAEIVVKDVGVAVEKTTSQQVVVLGDEVPFDITLTNTGQAELTVREVVDPSASACNLDAESLRQNPVMLAPGESRPYTCTATVSNRQINGGQFTNTIKAIGASLGVTVEDEDTISLPAASVLIIKGPDKQHILNRESANFTILVKNNGSVPLTDIQVTDDVAPACSAIPEARKPDTLVPGEQFSYECSLKIDEPTEVWVMNVAKVTADAMGRKVEATSNQVELDSIIPKLVVTKSARQSELHLGQEAIFDVVVENPSSAQFTNVTVMDSLASDCVTKGREAIPGGVVNPKSVTSFTCTMPSPSEANVPADGIVVNSITVEGETFGATYRAIDEERVKYTIPRTQVSVTELETRAVTLKVSTLVVRETNNGNVPLTDVYVEFVPDGMDPSLGLTLRHTSPEFVSGDLNRDGVLDVGETWEWRVVTIAVQAPGAYILDGNKEITYRATGHGTDPTDQDVTFPAYPQEQDTVTIAVSGG